MKHLYLLFILSFSISFAQNSSKSNYLANGDFESGITGMALNNNARGTVEASDVTRSTSSTGSVKFTVNLGSAANEILFFGGSQAVTDSGIYHFGFWIKADAATAASPQTFKVGGNNKNTAGTGTYPRSPLITLTDTNWHYIVYSTAVGLGSDGKGADGTGSAELRPIIWTDADGVFYIDDAKLFLGVPSGDMEVAAHLPGAATSLPSGAGAASVHYNSQNYGGSNQISSFGYDTSEKYSGNKSLKVVTTATTNDDDLQGTVVVKQNDNKGFRPVQYVNQNIGTGSDATTYPFITYTGSVWVKATSEAKFQLNLKLGGEPNRSAVTTLAADTWTEVQVSAQMARNNDGIKVILPTFLFLTPSATYYIDDMSVSWTEATEINTTPDLAFQGVVDFSLPGKWMKGVHLKANADISDLSIYAVGNHNSGGSGDSSESGSVTLSGSATAGDDIFVWDSNAGETAADIYMNASNVFSQSIYNAEMDNFNGDDALTLKKSGEVIETFGVIGTDGTGESWEYMDTWAYKVDGAWTYGTVNCTDGSYFTWDSGCTYPLAVGKELTGTYSNKVTSFSENMADMPGSDSFYYKEDEAPIKRTTSSQNPTGGTAMQYVDDGTFQYSNMQIRFKSKVDLTQMNTITLKAYIHGDSLSGTQTNQLALKLQDLSESQPWNNQNVVTQEIDSVDVWKELTFTFNDSASMARDDVDNIVVQFNGENNNDKVYAYIKDVVGSYTEPSSTTVTPNDNLVITFDESWVTDGDDKDVYGDAGATVTIIDDPSNSNKGKVLNVQYNESANDWQNAQMILNAAKSQKALDLRTIKTVTFDVWTSHDDSDSNKGTYTGLLKLENRVGGGSTIEKSFPVAGNGWETVTVDFSDVNGHEGQFAKIVLFTNYGSGTHKKDDLRIYDNFKYAEGDAFQADAVPATAAPTPTVSEVNVMNIYSDAYSNTTVWSDNEIRAGWSSGGEVKEIDFSSTDKMLKLKEANYIGQYWTTTDNARGPIDLTKYDKMSVDVWVEAISTDKTLGIALLTSDEKKVDYTIAAGDAGWRTIELDVSNYGGIDAVNGVKWEPNPQGSISLMYIDNFYAYDSTLSIDDLEESTITIYPNPSTGIVNITGVEQVDEIRVFTISGQLVKKAENTSSIDLSSEMRGLYMIEIESDGKTIVNRLIKE